MLQPPGLSDGNNVKDRVRSLEAALAHLSECKAVLVTHLVPPVRVDTGNSDGERREATMTTDDAVALDTGVTQKMIIAIKDLLKLYGSLNASSKIPSVATVATTVATSVRDRQAQLKDIFRTLLLSSR